VQYAPPYAALSLRSGLRSKRARIWYAILRIAEKQESARVVNFFQGKIKNKNFKKNSKLHTEKS
jgi:hypothetical protein